MLNSRRFLYGVLFASCLALFPVMAQSDEPPESDMPVPPPPAQVAPPAQAPAPTMSGVSVPLPPPRVVSKDEGAMSDQCSKSGDSDKKNLCMAKQTVQMKAFGYEVKNHGSYYCSLIKERDLQSYCYAVVTATPSLCDSIVKPDVEQECKANFKS